MYLKFSGGGGNNRCGELKQRVTMVDRICTLSRWKLSAMGVVKINGDVVCHPSKLGVGLG